LPHPLFTRPIAALRHIRLILPALAAGLVISCQREAAPEVFVPNTGQIQILNGCGKPGAAEVFRSALTDLGFDVIEFGNAKTWNYENTMVISRSGTDRIASDLAKVLCTPYLIHLTHPESLVEATVVIGKDYEELMKKWPHPKQKS
jgi:hypothetical protein